MCADIALQCAALLCIIRRTHHIYIYIYVYVYIYIYIYSCLPIIKVINIYIHCIYA